MSWTDKITTTIFGRRLGLQTFSTAQSGASAGRTFDVLVGAEAVRPYVSSAETTSTNMPAFGVSFLTTTSTTNSVYTLDPPISGVEKTIVIGSTNTATNMISVRTSTGATVCFTSSNGSTLCVIASSGGSQSVIRLVGINSTQWASVGLTTSAGFSLTTST
jgi:acetylglutamate synthase